MAKKPEKTKLEVTEVKATRNETQRLQFRGQNLFRRLLKHYYSNYDRDIAIPL